MLPMQVLGKWCGRIKRRFMNGIKENIKVAYSLLFHSLFYGYPAIFYGRVTIEDAKNRSRWKKAICCGDP